MFMRFTVDLDFRIHDIVTATDAAPFAPCFSVPPDFGCLKGLTIERGFNRKVQQLLGGTHGCTHLRELLGRLANTAHQATYQARRERDGAGNLDRGRMVLDSCRGYASTSPAILARWPSLYTGPRPD
jgi:hypothetical protein